MICIRALQVRQGDSFLLSFQKENASQLLVIDSGYGITYPHFKQNLLEMFKQYNCKAQMFLTHVDLDHIGGYIRLFTDPEFQEYDRISAFYYNSIESLQSVCGGEFPDTGQSADIVFMNTNTGYKDAVKLETLLKVKGVPVEAGLLASRQIDLGPDIRTVILSPSRSSLVNYQAWAANKDGRHAVKLQTSAARYDYGQPLEELRKR